MRGSFHRFWLNECVLALQELGGDTRVSLQSEGDSDQSRNVSASRGIIPLTLLSDRGQACDAAGGGGFHGNCR